MSSESVFFLEQLLLLLVLWSVVISVHKTRSKQWKNLCIKNMIALTYKNFVVELEIDVNE